MKMDHLDVDTDDSCPHAPHDYCYYCAEQAAKPLKARIKALETNIGEWLDYEENSSNCPNCGCTSDEPCIFLEASRLLKESGE